MLKQIRLIPLLITALITANCGGLLSSSDTKSQNNAHDIFKCDAETCGGGGIEPTPIPDQIAITNPDVHGSASGIVLINVSLYMAAGIDRVEFYLDFWATNSLMGSVNTAPYQLSWNTSQVAAGIHTLGARAYDKAGNFIEEAHDVIVGNQMAIVSPSVGQVVSGTVTISANVSMPVGVDRVLFYLDHWNASSLLGTVSSAPYELEWNTVGLDNGLHTLGVQAYDIWGNLVAEAHDVDVENPLNPTSPPSAPVLFFANLQGPSTVQLTWIDTANNEQSFVVERAIGDNPFTVLATLPGNSKAYNDIGLAPATTYKYRVKAVNAAGSSAYTSVVTRITPSANIVINGSSGDINPILKNGVSQEL